MGLSVSAPYCLFNHWFSPFTHGYFIWFKLSAISPHPAEYLNTQLKVSAEVTVRTDTLRCYPHPCLLDRSLRFPLPELERGFSLDREVSFEGLPHTDSLPLFASAPVKLTQTSQLWLQGRPDPVRGKSMWILLLISVYLGSSLIKHYQEIYVCGLHFHIFWGSQHLGLLDHCPFRSMAFKSMLIAFI